VYHAPTVSVYRKFLAAAIVLAASGSAAAQTTATEGGDGAQSHTAWRAYPNERHLLLRALGGAAIVLPNAWGNGVLAPPFVFAEGSYLFRSFGPVRMGPSLGFQAGFDLTHANPQFAVQPGWMLLFRPSAAVGVSLRLDVPILFTRGSCSAPTVDPFAVAMIPGPPIQPPGPGDPCYSVGFGFELAPSIMYYVTSGFALTAELSLGVYLGDSFAPSFPIGLGLGFVIDYEILP
jgi:hypothetical protein